MDKKIHVFGKEFRLKSVLVYVSFIVVFSIYSFVERSYIKEKYINADIEFFEDNHFWKIYLPLIILPFFIGVYLVRKSKYKVGMFIMNWLVFSVFSYVFLNKFITTQALFINQILSVEKKIIVYDVFNRNNFVSLIDDTKEKSMIDIFDKEIIKKIEDKRKMNHQKSLEQIKHGDTIHVNFEKGLFGFKYIN